MANITLTSADLLIPEVWANEGIRALRRKIRLARARHRDSDYGTFNEGDKLNIPLPVVRGEHQDGRRRGHVAAADRLDHLGHPQPAQGGFVPPRGRGEGHARWPRRRSDRHRALHERRHQAHRPRDRGCALGSLRGFSTTVGTSGTDITSATLRSVAKAFNDAASPRRTATSSWRRRTTRRCRPTPRSPRSLQRDARGHQDRCAHEHRRPQHRLVEPCPRRRRLPELDEEHCARPRRDDPRHAEPPHRREHDGRPARPSWSTRSPASRSG